MVIKCQPIRAAIIGSGNIGADILVKLNRSEYIDCVLFSGRRPESAGIHFAKSLNVETTIDGINGLCENSSNYDIVFDATSAESHKKHAELFKRMGKVVVDLTPAKVGKLCVPFLNISKLLGEANISMITCGGQASTPIAHALGKVHPNMEYVEVVSSIAAMSAGEATRSNIDEYIDTTEKAIKKFTGCQRSKAILNINPSIPSVDMKTTIFAKIDKPDMCSIKNTVFNAVENVQKYVPGYELVVEPWYNGKQVMVMVRVTGSGDYLPKFAGNLDIITCAAVRAGEAIAHHRCSSLRETAA